MGKPVHMMSLNHVRVVCDESDDNVWVVHAAISNGRTRQSVCSAVPPAEVLDTTR